MAAQCGYLVSVLIIQHLSMSSYMVIIKSDLSTILAVSGVTPMADRYLS